MEQTVAEKIISINPEGLYFANYSIDNKGNKTYKSCVLKGKDLTQNQIKTCEEIPQHNL